MELREFDLRLVAGGAGGVDAAMLGETVKTEAFG